MSTPIDALIAQLQETGLVPPDRLAEFIPPAANPTDAQAWTTQLVDRGLLTKFQASQVATGKAKSLLIGAYAMLDRVSGGGGLLFKAQHRRMQRVVFIKPLAPSLMKSAAPRVQREVAAAGRLPHPNLVAVNDLDEVGGAHFLVTECVDGSDLATLLQQGKPTIETACNYVAQAAAGLAYAHAQGAVHRDVKAENVFVDRSGVVKVFGLGVSASEAGDAAGDVAALGRLLYRMLCGAEVPAGATPSLRATRPDVTPALDAYWARLMSATPAERPTAAEASVALKSLDTLPVPPVVGSDGQAFPELFAGAEEEAATVMAIDMSAVPPPMPLPVPPQPAAVVAPAPIAPAPAPAFAPAPAYAPVPAPAPAPIAAMPDAFPPSVAPAPAFAPAPAPAPVAPAPAMMFPTAPQPAAPEFAVGMVPPAAAVAPAPAPAPLAPVMGFAPPAPAAPAVAPAADNPFTISFAAAPAPAPAAEAMPTGDSSEPTSTTAAKKPGGKKKRTKPIELPFNLELDAKYLEPKYLAGAGGGLLVVLCLFLWLMGGGNQPAKVKLAPVVRQPQSQPNAPAAVQPGMFNLPSSATLPSSRPANYGEKPEYDEFGFQKQGTAKPQPKR